MSAGTGRSLRRGCLLAVWYGFLFVVASTLWMIAFWGTDRFGGPAQFGREVAPRYNWAGGPLVVERDIEVTTCEVRPERGETRRLNLETLPEVESAEHGGFFRQVRDYPPVRVDRWFSGPASVSCDQQVRAVSGGRAGFRLAVTGDWFTYGLVVLVLLPIVPGMVRRRRRDGRRHG